jgi:hypothetical protein
MDGLWTETSKTMSQDKLFLFLSWSSQVCVTLAEGWVLQKFFASSYHCSENMIPKVPRIVEMDFLES